MNLTTHNVRHDLVSVKWHVPLLTYGPEIYSVIYGTDQEIMTNAKTNISHNTAQLTNLAANTKYYYRVHARNVADSAISNISSFTTLILRMCICVHERLMYICMFACVCLCVSARLV